MEDGDRMVGQRADWMAGTEVRKRRQGLHTFLWGVLLKWGCWLGKDMG